MVGHFLRLSLDFCFFLSFFSVLLLVLLVFGLVVDDYVGWDGSGGGSGDGDGFQLLQGEVGSCEAERGGREESRHR